MAYSKFNGEVYNKYIVDDSAHKQIMSFLDNCDKSANNIWCVIPFSKSTYYTYLQNINTGAKLPTYYSYADTCISSFSQLASDLFYFNQNRTGKVNGPTYKKATWFELMFNITGVIAGDFSNTIYYCYKFEDSVKVYTLKRWSTFVDVNDFYTSLLFNLLA